MPSPTDSLLVRLDDALAARPGFDEHKQTRIETLRRMLDQTGADDEQAYLLNRELFNECRTFRFDEASECLYRGLEVAHRLGSDEKANDMLILLASLYTDAGMYFEANEIFTAQLDTLRLPQRQMTSYWLVRQKFCHELAQYTRDQLAADMSRRQYGYYCTRLFGQPARDDDPFELSDGRIRNLVYNRRFDEAEQLLGTLLGRYAPDTHEYAILAYNMGVVCDQTERHDEMAAWYARSAYADVCTSTRDYASLCSLANYLFGQDDLPRAFRYIRISMDDALFYNARLRPWQVAASMPHIESAMNGMRDNQRRQAWISVLVISVLVVILAALCVYLGIVYRKAHADRIALHSRNLQIDSQNRELSQLNRTIIEANYVKEEYIGRFLSICSEYIDRLIETQRNIRRKLSAGKIAELQREAASQEMVDEETQRFYKIFDTSFLSLYPTFVEDFNSLLDESGRIELHKGELLNTELRIFALIRLGITDSSKIAQMLRYSVNTIYNYRAKVKNRARNNREDFEERIKSIGSFKGD